MSKTGERTPLSGLFMAKNSDIMKKNSENEPKGAKNESKR